MHSLLVAFWKTKWPSLVYGVLSIGLILHSCEERTTRELLLCWRGAFVANILVKTASLLIKLIYVEQVS